MSYRSRTRPDNWNSTVVGTGIGHPPDLGEDLSRRERRPIRRRHARHKGCPISTGCGRGRHRGGWRLRRAQMHHLYRNREGLDRRTSRRSRLMIRDLKPGDARCYGDVLKQEQATRNAGAVRRILGSTDLLQNSAASTVCVSHMPPAAASPGRVVSSKSPTCNRRVVPISRSLTMNTWPGTIVGTTANSE